MSHLRPHIEQKLRIDFAPVVSAWNKGHRRIAEARWQKICNEKELVLWETSVISREIVRPQIINIH